MGFYGDDGKENGNYWDSRDSMNVQKPPRLQGKKPGLGLRGLGLKGFGFRV